MREIKLYHSNGENGMTMVDMHRSHLILTHLTFSLVIPKKNNHIIDILQKLEGPLQN